MKFRTMLGLAAVGGFLYWHRQRGGDWTIASFQKSAGDLYKMLAKSARRAEAEAHDALDEASKKAQRAADRLRH